MSYTFTVDDADEFLTPRVDQGATHALKMRDQRTPTSSQTDVHGLTDAELVRLFYAVAERLSERYSVVKEHFKADDLSPRGAW